MFARVRVLSQFTRQDYMRCKQCGTRWSADWSAGPGGAMAPGGYLIASAIIAIIALVVMLCIDWIVSVIIWIFSFALLSMTLNGCGYRPSDNNGYGSHCPKCDKKHTIWPWSL